MGDSEASFRNQSHFRGTVGEMKGRGAIFSEMMAGIGHYQREPRVVDLEWQLTKEREHHRRQYLGR